MLLGIAERRVPRRAVATGDRAPRGHGGRRVAVVQACGAAVNASLRRIKYMAHGSCPRFVSPGPKKMNVERFAGVPVRRSNRGDVQPSSMLVGVGVWGWLIDGHDVLLFRF